MTDPTTSASDPQPAAGLNWELIMAILDLFERHGYRQADRQHVGRAIGLLGRAARVYSGQED